MFIRLFNWRHGNNPLLPIDGDRLACVLIMALAVFNGLVTSIVLETIILYKQMGLKLGLKTALGMSLISMISMEVAMNLTDFFLTGGATLNWWVVPIMLVVGFITPLPYNYWRLKALEKVVAPKSKLGKLIQ